jgi:exopolyphosphatase/guanosine-5'-triphosphate,3'-diphosphate pyrophosphatase
MAGNLFSSSSISSTPEIGTPTKDGRIGIVDIGSNTVRLVVYDAPARLPVPIFNERVSCELGKGLGHSGRLNPEGVELAYRTLGRFTSLAREMGVENFVMLATAAVREASDGAEFTAEIERRFGYPVQVLSGSEEARLGAMGILGGSPKADGLSGDLGGGSLDLVSLDIGEFGRSATLPLGHLRVAEDSDQDTKLAKTLIAEQFDNCSWLGSTPGRTLFAVGGAWRAIARIYIEQTKYPLHVLDNFTVETSDALSLTELIGGLSPKSLEQMAGVARRRADTLPFAALVLNRLLEITQPKQLVFSGYGLREGQFFEMLPPEMKKEDPLISACEGFAVRSGRFSVHGEEIASWMAPLFKDETERYHRLCHAAALLSDIGWTEHPDYRALHAFLRVLRLPISGVTHRQRVMLALAVYVRYNGKRKQYEVQQVRDIISEKDQHRASVMGVALRLAHMLSGGVPGILPRTTLHISKAKLKLKVDKASRVLIGDAVEKLFYDLADMLEIEGSIK